ncbi:DUF6708 domain-containing protein [Pseudomonas aeruginosa]
MNAFRPVPKNERSVFSSRVEALRGNDPSIGIEPGADNNVVRVTESCLFIRSASASLYGGRQSMSWWATIAFYLVTALMVFSGYLSFTYARTHEGFIGNFFYYCIYNIEIIGIPFLLFASCFWMFIPWRRQLPIVFNRRTQKVTCYINDRLEQCDWLSLEAYIKDVTTFAAGGSPINEGVLALVFPGHETRSGLKPRIGIKGTEDSPEAIKNGGFYGAAMIWEYIREYMCVREDAVPAPAPFAKYRSSGVRDCIDFMNPWMPFTYRVWWKLLMAIVLSPILVPFLSCVLLGDITYMLLDRILPRRRWPYGLIDACDGVWDGREN